MGVTVSCGTDVSVEQGLKPRSCRTAVIMGAVVGGGAGSSRESWASSPRSRRVMQGNRSRDTKPEIALRRALHAAGLRYRVCARPVPGLRSTADIVFRSARVAVEVRGCFWHGCPEHLKLSDRNRAYWTQKIARNRERDRTTEAAWRDAGWEVIVVWEHDDFIAAAQRVEETVRCRRRRGPKQV